MIPTVQELPLFDRIALSLIDLYKSFLSGSFVLRDRNCSFQGDTCSTYTKRAVQMHGFREGYKIARERMKRCNDYRLFYVGDKALAWTKGFDAIMDNPSRDNIETLVQTLHEKDEGKESIGYILNGAQLLHEYCYGAKSDSIQEFIESEGVQDIKPKIRNARGFKHYFERRLLKRTGIAVAIAGTAFFLLDGLPEAVVDVAAILYLVDSFKKYSKALGFFDYFIQLKNISESYGQ